MVIKYWSLRLQLMAICFGIVAIVDANAETDTNPDMPAQDISGQASTEERANLALTEAARLKIIAEAGALLKNGKPADAYGLMSPYQQDYAGDAEFDYLFGLAALDSGKPTEAIFALERVLAVQPGHLQARAEIARAYVATGETVAAQQEFETVKQQNPPATVVETIQKYLDIIETKRSSSKASLRGYIEAGLGHDSNVNSATGNTHVAIPFFGSIARPLSTDGVARSDNFSSIAAGFTFRHPVSRRWTVLGGANINQHINYKLDTFDTGSLDGSVGLDFANDSSNYTVVLQGQRYDVDNEAYRDAQGVAAQWQSNPQGSSLASVYLQYTELTYPEQSFRDVNRSVLGGAYAFALNAGPSILYISGYGGSEKEKNEQPENAQFGHILYGLRIGTEKNLNEQTTFLASAGVESRRYGGADTLFETTRKDKQADARLAVGFHAGQKWILTPSLDYIRNRSNIVIYDYKRTALSLSLRRNFN